MAVNFLHCGNRVQKMGGMLRASSQNQAFAEQIARTTGIGSETR